MEWLTTELSRVQESGRVTHQGLNKATGMGKQHM
jgi:hypothetical protein